VALDLRAKDDVVKRASSIVENHPNRLRVHRLLLGTRPETEQTPVLPIDRLWLNSQ